MSVDTSFARTISTPNVAGTLSAWDAMQLVLGAERATKAAALRRELDAEPAKERTAADVEKDIERYSAWLTAPSVIHCLPWYLDVTARLNAAKAELAAMSGGAK